MDKWRQMAHVNPQGAVLWYLRDQTRHGSPRVGLTAQEVSTELGIPLYKVREHLSLWHTMKHLAQREVQSRTGARLWYAVPGWKPPISERDGL
jgi:hypothetical protein